MELFIFAIFILSPTYASSVIGSNLPIPIGQIEQDVNQGSLTVDDFLNQTFRTHKSSYFDSQTSSVVITGTIVFNPPHEFSPSEIAKLNLIAEKGQWTSSTGQHYDLKNATLIFRDGHGGLGDILAYFASYGITQMPKFKNYYPPSLSLQQIEDPLFRSEVFLTLNSHNQETVSDSMIQRFSTILTFKPFFTCEELFRK